MRSGKRMSKHYSVRTVPGAGENFITTLLTNHYNLKHNVQYYDDEFNEYFINSELIVKENGSIESPFWSGTGWDFIRCELRKDNEYQQRVVHEHEWIDEGDEYIRRFNVNKMDPTLGVDPDKIIKDTLEGFWVSCTTKEETDFVKKVFIVKRYFGSRPPVIYNQSDSSLNGTREFKIIRSLSSVGNDKEVVKYILLAMSKMNFKEFVDIWKEYFYFLKELPLNYSLSCWNSHYFYQWLQNPNFELCDIDNYIISFQSFIEKELKSCPRLLHIDPNREQHMEKVIRSYGKKINVIRYRDFFLEQKPTGTVLDQYINEVLEYTNKNKKLVKDFENFYDEILL